MIKIREGYPPKNFTWASEICAADDVLGIIYAKTEYDNEWLPVPNMYIISSDVGFKETVRTPMNLYSQGLVPKVELSGTFEYERRNTKLLAKQNLEQFTKAIQKHIASDEQNYNHLVVYTELPKQRIQPVITILEQYTSQFPKITICCR